MRASTTAPLTPADRADTAPRQRYAVYAVVEVPLFFFLAILYGLSSMGRFNSTDGRDMYHTAVSLLLRHSLAISPDIGTFIGRNGASYAKYGIGQSLAEMPLALLDQLAHGLGLFTSAPQLFGSMTNAWITAAGVVVFYRLLRDLAYTPGVALTTALAYGLTTSAWVYAKLDFSEPLLTLTLLLAALACRRFKLTGRLRWVALAGAALGYAALTKYAAIALIPLFAIYLYLVWRASEQRAPGWASLARLLRMLVAFGAPILAGVGATLAVNWVRSGSPFITGYVAYERPFNQSPPLTLNAAAALLLSPRYGLVFFVTPVLLGLVGFLAFQWRAPLEAWGVVALGVVTLALYATYPTWYGGWVWGPRFLVPIVPFLMLPAAEVFAMPTRSRRATRLVWTALAAGLAEQLLGVLVNYRADYDILPWMRPPDAHVWEPWASPLLSHLLFLPPALIANLVAGMPVVNPATALMSLALRQFREFFAFFWFGQFPQPMLVLLIGVACALPTLAAAGYALMLQLTAPARSAAPSSE